MKTAQSKRNISRPLVCGSLLVFVSIIFCGCDTPEQNNAASTLFNADAAVATDPRQAALWGILGAGAANEAQMQNQREVAVAGQSQITINNNANYRTTGTSGYWVPPSSAPSVISFLVVDPTGHTSVNNVRMDNGSSYSGSATVLDGKSRVQPDGEGTMVFDNGERHHGNFSNGIFMGETVESESEKPAANDIIHVPSVDEMKAGAKITVVKAEDLKINNTGASNPGATGLMNGSVIVTADDASFDVFADGAFVGNSPAKLKLSEGSHVIEVKKAGFKDYKKVIKVTDGSELNLKAVLEKE